MFLLSGVDKSLGGVDSYGSVVYAGSAASSMHVASDGPGYIRLICTLRCQVNLEATDADPPRLKIAH